MQVSEQTVASVAKKVLETMAFAFEMPGEEGPPPGGDLVEATVAFSGPFAGRVRLTLPAEIVPELVANMLGDEQPEPPTPQQQHDAVGELANVMCGNLVQEIAGPKPVFRLDPPQVESKNAPYPTAAPAEVVAHIPLETGWARLSLVLEPSCVEATAP